MKSFSAPLDDIFFSLEVLRGDMLPDWDEALAREIAAHFASFAEAVIAPLNSSGDVEGCRFENGRVYMPSGFRDAYRQLADDGWQGLTAPEEFGGQGLSPLELAVTSEIFSGANHALQMITGLVPGAIRTLLNFGTDAQKADYIPHLASGEMLATMCLTEPSAGSDLAAIRTKAVRANEGWEITGEKIFISGGDQDLSEDIFHLVLARTSNDGIKGLSLFIVEGRVNVTRIEEKMGLHASPTCQIAFDGTKAALIGREGQGLLAMFTMMNHARIDVALQGAAHAARAWDIAHHYASERIQGQVNGKAARLIAHADVARMVDKIDALALSARGFAHMALIALEGEMNEALTEFLTPLAKVYATQAGMEAAELGVQVLGGYGYLHEYQVEQVYRDARITAIYEGANGIHTRALATRALKTGAADAFSQFLSENGLDARAHQAWSEFATYLKTCDDPLPFAHDFAGLSAQCLCLVLANKFHDNADRHTDAKRIQRVTKALQVEASAKLAYHMARFESHLKTP